MAKSLFLIPLSHLSLNNMHLEGEGSLGADISTMTSVHKHSIEKIFHNRAKIRNIFSHLTLTPPVHFVQWHDSGGIARFSQGAGISTMYGQCESIQLKKSKEKV